MIVEKEVKIIGHRTNFEHYKKKGYDIQYRKPLMVNISDMMSGSTTKVTTICDICGTESIAEYRFYFEYTKGLTEQYYCNKCNKSKSKETCLKKYGVENPMQVKEIKDKLKKSMFDKYGVEHYSMTDEYKSKYKKTCLEKYGVENSFQSNDIKEEIKKSNLKNHGVEYPQQSEEVRLKSNRSNLEKYGFEKYSQTQECKSQIKETCLEKYGVDNYSKTDDYKIQVKDTCLEKYGVDNYSKTNDYKIQTKETCLEKYGVDHYSKTDEFKSIVKVKREGITKLRYDNLISDGYSIELYTGRNFTIYHEVCNNKFDINRDNLYSRINLDICLCTVCYPVDVQQSYMEIELQNFLNQHEVSYITRDKSILDGKEIDIYLPEHNLAIEMNGVYWHSEIYVDNKYHLNKTLLCRERGIHLIHIWEDDWKYKSDIVKSIISNKIGIISNKVFARNCILGEVSSSDARLFLDENHIQGFAASSIRIGLYHNNDLVSLMTFGYRYTNGKREFELIRFCNKINTNVVGASSKIFKHLLKIVNVDNIISYSDISMFGGLMYGILGFKEISTSDPNYFWVVDGVRKHRFNYNKQNLGKQGFDISKTEVEIMHNRGYYRIWGCGQKKWIYNVEKAVYLQNILNN